MKSQLLAGVAVAIVFILGIGSLGLVVMGTTQLMNHAVHDTRTGAAGQALPGGFESRTTDGGAFPFHRAN